MNALAASTNRRSVNLLGQPQFIYRHTRFFGYLNCKNASFRSGSNFYGAIFLGAALFENCSFLQEGDFQHSQFRGGAIFECATFWKPANFCNATFFDTIYFSETYFHDQADFSASLAKTRSSDSGDSFINATFSGAWFDGDVDFTNRDMVGLVDLTDATFMGLAQFHGASFHQGLMMTGASFHDVLEPDGLLRKISDAISDFFVKPRIHHPPQPPSDIQRRLFESCTSPEGHEEGETATFEDWREEFLSERATRLTTARAKRTDKEYAAIENAFQTLKLGMETLRRQNEEQRFFALELRARRRRTQGVGWSEKAVSYIYQLTANFGGSFLRPIGFLVVLVLPVFAYLFYLLATIAPANAAGSPLKAQSWCETVVETLSLSFQNIFRPFSIWRASDLDLADPADNTLAAVLLADPGHPVALATRLIGTVESFVAIALLFLAALALRRRFQMS